MQRKFISRRSFLKCAGGGAVTAAAAGLLAGCGGSDSSSSSAASSAAPAEPADPSKPYAGVTLYYAATDNIPAEQFKAAWFDPARKVLSEKIVGTADTTISQIWTSEAPLYGMGQQDLDTTMQNILDRSNEAIKEAELY